MATLSGMNRSALFTLPRTAHVAALLAAALFQAASSSAAGSTASFLKINPSARTAALGASGAAVANDASSVFSNPAGLASAPAASLIASHAELFLQSHLDVLGFAQSTHLGTFGITATYLSQPAMETRDENRKATGSLSSGEGAVGLSYGSRLGDRLRAGITVKELTERIGSASADGLAADLGAQMTVADSLLAGVAVTNLGQGLKLGSERNSLPTAVSAGVGYLMGKVLLTLDGNAPLHGGNANVGLGVELVPFSSITVRGGYLVNAGSSIGNVSKAATLSQYAGFGAGLGVTVGNYTIDYALVPSAELSPTQLFTISAMFR